MGGKREWERKEGGDKQNTTNSFLFSSFSPPSSLHLPDDQEKFW